MVQHAETHYELLGLVPDASAELIRRAYVEQARASHPDHQPPGRQAEAADRMARVNEAWRVLRDPEQRAAYDVSIGVARLSTPPPAAGVGESGGSPASGAPQPVRVGAAATTYDQAPGCGPGIWVGAGVGVVVLFLALLVAFVVAGSDPAPSPSPTSLPEGFAAGDCVLVGPSASGMTATKVPCGGSPVSGRVTAVMAYPTPCPAQTLEVPLVSERTTLCLVED